MSYLLIITNMQAHTHWTHIETHSLKTNWGWLSLEWDGMSPSQIPVHLSLIRGSAGYASPLTLALCRALGVPKFVPVLAFIPLILAGGGGGGCISSTITISLPLKSTFLSWLSLFLFVCFSSLVQVILNPCHCFWLLHVSFASMHRNQSSVYGAPKGWTVSNCLNSSNTQLYQQVALTLCCTQCPWLWAGQITPPPPHPLTGLIPPACSNTDLGYLKHVMSLTSSGWRLLRNSKLNDLYLGFSLVCWKKLSI